MHGENNAREAGKRAVAGVSRTLASKAADLLQRNPDRMASAVEMGLVDRSWLERPGEVPFTHAAPLEVVERFLERSVEQRPSLLASLGLSAIQILSSESEAESGEPGVSTSMVVAFTDLVGFTAFTGDHGDEAASRLLLEHHRTVGPIVRSRGGRIVKRLGDGLLLTFPSAEAGVLACLELVDAAPEPLQLRAGAHIGEVMVIRDDVVGQVVNVAARVAEAAKGGEVLLTSDLCDAIDDGLPGISFGRRRRRRFKGVDEPIRVSVVTAAR